MKSDPKVLAILNNLLADELTAINQYMVHSEMCDGWGYGRLHKHIEKRAIDEMKHAEKLIGRILFLEGRPIVSDLRKINIGGDVRAILANDQAAEQEAIRAYNEAIRNIGDLGDHGTCDFLQGILKDEEAHIDGIESQLDQIQQMDLKNFLVEQIEE